MLPIRDDNRLATASTIRLSLSVAAARCQISGGHSEQRLSDYRQGQSASDYGVLRCTEYVGSTLRPCFRHRLCGKRFRRTAGWNAFHSEGAVSGDDRSVASPMVSNGDYSCMSMYFDEPLARGSDISFQLAAGRGN